MDVSVADEVLEAVCMTKDGEDVNPEDLRRLRKTIDALLCESSDPEVKSPVAQVLPDEPGKELAPAPVSEPEEPAAQEAIPVQASFLPEAPAHVPAAPAENLPVRAFNFHEHTVRTVVIDGAIWFVGNDVAECLGYTDPRRAVATHCKGRAIRPVPTPGGVQKMLIIPKSDVYRLAGRSDLPEAEKFQDWVYEEVLPSIDKHGAYMTPATAAQAQINPDFLRQLANTLEEEARLRREAETQAMYLTAENEKMRPDAELGR